MAQQSQPAALLALSVPLLDSKCSHCVLAARSSTQLEQPAKRVRLDDSVLMGVTVVLASVGTSVGPGSNTLIRMHRGTVRLDTTAWKGPVSLFRPPVLLESTSPQLVLFSSLIAKHVSLATSVLPLCPLSVDLVVIALSSTQALIKKH